MKPDIQFTTIINIISVPKGKTSLTPRCNFIGRCIYYSFDLPQLSAFVLKGIDFSGKSAKVK